MPFIPICHDHEGECGERGERGKSGKRGHRGHRGHDGHDGRDGDTGPTGPTGPTGSTGPTGPTGTADILHVEAKQQGVATPLPPFAQTTVLTCPPIAAPVGAILEFTGIVQYVNSGNSNGFAQPSVILFQDGFPNDVVIFAETPGAFPQGPTFLITAILPLTWYLAGDGLPHVYSLVVQTDNVSDGTQVAGNASLFINVIE